MIFMSEQVNRRVEGLLAGSISLYSVRWLIPGSAWAWGRLGGAALAAYFSAVRVAAAFADHGLPLVSSHLGTVLLHF